VQGKPRLPNSLALDDALKALADKKQGGGVKISGARGFGDWQLPDMHTLAFEEEVGAALCFGNSFGYLSRTDTKHFLK
jgi:hypothetical protein